MHSQLRYGDRVHAALMPIFEKSLCTAYFADFYKHDLAQLQKVACPGQELLWIVTPNGTHLFVLDGYTRDAAAAALHAYGTCEAYLVKVGLTKESIKAVSKEQALALASRPHQVTAGFVSHTAEHRQFELRKGEQPFAQVRFRAHYERDGNTGWVIDIEVCAHPGTQVLWMCLGLELISHTISHAMGTLFWSTGNLTIDGVQGRDWRDQVLALPALAEAA